VPREFIENYGQIALRDAAAQLFLSNATSVLNISTLDDYPFNNNTSAAAVGTYLRKRSIAQLLLSGIDSSHGIAWITLYKTDDRIRELLDITASDEDKEMQVRKEWSSKNKNAKPRFTTMQCEFASYIIRAGLYDWQLACKRPVERELDTDRYKMIDLSPIELDVAVRAARSYVVKEISGELKISEYTVNKHLAAMRTAGFTRSGMAKRLIGKLPDHREPATKRTGRSPKNK
jgi:DNA-binding CsgD family transcriptional regulator